MRAVRAFVASTVVVGAVRGLEFGHALHSRRTRRARRLLDKDGQVEKLLKNKRVRDLLQKEPSVGMQEICETLDRLEVKIPWESLAKKNVPENRLWKTHARAAVVKNTISKARKRVRQISNDMRYVKAFIRREPTPAND
jgi:hypothetical protein